MQPPLCCCVSVDSAVEGVTPAGPGAFAAGHTPHMLTFVTPSPTGAPAAPPAVQHKGAETVAVTSCTVSQPRPGAWCSAMGMHELCCRWPACRLLRNPVQLTAADGGPYTESHVGFAVLQAVTCNTAACTQFCMMWQLQITSNCCWRTHCTD